MHSVVASRLPQVSITKTSLLAILWTNISMALPEGPGIAVKVDYVGPIAVTPTANTYILLFTDIFSCQANTLQSMQPSSQLRHS